MFIIIYCILILILSIWIECKFNWKDDGTVFVSIVFMGLIVLCFICGCTGNNNKFENLQSMYMNGCSSEYITETESFNLLPINKEGMFVIYNKDKLKIFVEKKNGERFYKHVSGTTISFNDEEEPQLVINKTKSIGGWMIWPWCQELKENPINMNNVSELVLPMSHKKYFN